MTEKQTLYFMKVYEKKNIALASDELYVSRPVVSRAIAELEREFDTLLLSHLSTGVEPTDEGIAVYRLICNMTANYNSLAADIKK